MLRHQIEERKRERRRPVAPPSSSHRRRYSARYGLTDPSDLDVVPAEFTRHDFEHRRTQAWVDWSPPLADWQTLWVDWRQPPTMFFFFVGGGREQRVRAKRWSTGVASCVEEILDGGRGSTGTREANPRSCFWSQKKRYKRTSQAAEK